MTTPIAPGYPQLGKFLVKHRLISMVQMEIALRVTERWDCTFRENVFRLGYTTEENFVGFLSRHYDVPAIDLKQVDIDPEAIKLIPRKLALKYCLIIVRREDKKIYIAFYDPTNVFALDDVKFIAGYDIVPLVCSEREIIKAIEKSYGPEPPGSGSKICF